METTKLNPILLKVGDHFFPITRLIPKKLFKIHSIWGGAQCGSKAIENCVIHNLKAKHLKTYFKRDFKKLQGLLL